MSGAEMVTFGPPVEYRVLGPIEVVGEDGAALPLASARQRLLLAFLLARAGQVVSADQLVDVLWNEQIPADPKDALQSQVSRLRQRLGPGAPVETSPAGYRFNALDNVDAHRFERLVGEARRLGGDPQAALDRWDAALSLWRGRAFQDLADHPALRPSATRLDGLRVEAAEARVEALLALKRLSEALAAAEALADEEPLRERPVELRMRALAAGGRYVEALRAYEAFRRTLAEEVGLDPSPELRALEAEILRYERPAAAPASDGSAAREGPARSRSGLGLRREGTRLPVAATSFVGRDDAIAAIVAAFRPSRLVTLAGPGGVGKSRLALETAHLLAGEHRDGAWLCELAPVADPGGVAFAVAAAVGVRQVRRTTIEDSLVDALATRELLVVVDNCEHVLDGVVPLLEQVLHQCSGVRVLATSRERLAADGETVVDVPPLELPDEKADPMTAWDQPAPALELLRDRITAVRPGFRPDARSHREAILDIARHLDGLPLALELAAARIATLGPLEVAGRLDQRFTLLTRGRRTALARHRTLRAAIDWSYDLLDDRERRTFERATVFVGGFTLDAAEHVCAVAGGVSRDDVPDIVTALVDKSMLIVDDRGPTTRYRMLETLRQFGHERLAARGELAPTERAHALCYAELAWRAEPHLRGPGEAEWVPLVDAELANLGAAHAWALRSGNRSVAAELSAALYWFAHWRTRTDVLAWAEQLADDEPADVGPHLARALAAAGHGAWMRGELARARVLGERAVAAAEGGSDARYGRHVLYAVALFEGRLDDSCDALRRAAALARRDGDHYHAAHALASQALVQAYSGDTEAAITNAGAGRVEAARSGSPSALAWSAYALGEVLSATEPDDALNHLDRAVELADTVAAHFIHGVALLSATSLRARHSDPATAASALSDVIDHWARAGNWRQQWTTLRHAVELFARLGNDQAAATVLGAIDASDATNLFGADAERLSVLRADLVARLGTAADQRMAEGREMSATDVVAFTRRQLAR